MSRYSVFQRKFVVRTYYSNKISPIVTLRKFKLKTTVPSMSTINRWIQKFERTVQFKENSKWAGFRKHVVHAKRRTTSSYQWSVSSAWRALYWADFVFRVLKIEKYGHWVGTLFSWSLGLIFWGVISKTKCILETPRASKTWKLRFRQLLKALNLRLFSELCRISLFVCTILHQEIV